MRDETKETAAKIKTALKARSGKTWSVTVARGSSAGWLTIEATPAHREDFGYTPKALRDELALLLRLDSVHQQGVLIPASSAHYREYIDRAEGRTPSVIAQPYW